jgi:tRNA-dihydrouridine synthase
MLGRGILMNPFLPSEIKNIEIGANKKSEKLKEFHNLILKYYTENLDNEGNVLNKMKQFWIYFSYNFDKQRKCLKPISKVNRMSKYENEIKLIFRDMIN